jgi:hypothetical protein
MSKHWEETPAGPTLAAYHDRQEAVRAPVLDSPKQEWSVGLFIGAQYLAGLRIDHMDLLAS